jgi:hypothetical protein
MSATATTTSFPTNTTLLFTPLFGDERPVQFVEDHSANWVHIKYTLGVGLGAHPVYSIVPRDRVRPA